MEKTFFSKTTRPSEEGFWGCVIAVLQNLSFACHNQKKTKCSLLDWKNVSSTKKKNIVCLKNALLKLFNGHLY